MMFAGPAIPIAALAIPLMAYLPTLYATRVGLSLGAVGAIFLLVRLIDIALDPIIGAIMDQGHTRFGRFRPWLVAGMAPLTLSVWMLFNPPAASGAGYLLTWLSVAYVAYSVCYLAHLSWGAALSSDYAARSRIFGWWQAGMLVGSIVVLATPIVAEGALHLSHDAGIKAMGWLIAGLLPMTVGLAVLGVSEPSESLKQDIARPKDYLALMLRPTVARLLAADLIIGTAIGMNSSLFFFYFGFVKHTPLLEITVLLFLNLCGSLCGTPLWSWLTGRIGKHRAAAWAFFFYALSLLVIAWMPLGISMARVVLFLAGLTLSAGPLLLRSMMADAGDEERLLTGQDRTGLISALFSGTNKLGLALAPGVTFLTLGWAGFRADGANTAMALNTLQALYIFAPAVLGVGTAALIWGHRLTAERHAWILAELDRSAIETAERPESQSALHA
jgi:Na+/melibiose symporter-like transporter